MPTVACVLACAGTALELAELFPAYAAAVLWCVGEFCPD
jgi:hypothetical protein